MKQEVFEIRDYLVENNYPQGLINILDDYFTNKAITREFDSLNDTKVL